MVQNINYRRESKQPIVDQLSMLLLGLVLRVPCQCISDSFWSTKRGSETAGFGALAHASVVIFVPGY